MKRDLRIIKTQENLRHALLTLLNTKPLDSIGVAELCRLAQINRGTFYSHYKDVHGVFKHYVEEIVKDLKLSYEEPFYRTNYHIENLEAGMIKIFHHVKNYQDFYKIIFDDRIPMMYYYLLFDRLRALLDQSVKDSNLQVASNTQIDYLTSYQTNALLGILIEWHRKDYETPIEELNQQLMRIISLSHSVLGF